MNNKIKVSEISPLIEEEVKFLVNSQEVICFNVSSQRIELGKEYEAEIDIFMNDFLEMEEQQSTKMKKSSHIENFRYAFWGKLLEDNVLDVGFFITSDLFEDYQYLVGKYVFLEVDRVQVYCE